MDSNHDETEYLSVREAARRLGVHENTVRNWARRGVVEGVLLPGSRYRRFRVSEIDRLAREQERAAAAGLRVDSTRQFVDTGYLDTWAGTKQAEALLPELVRRLIAGTNGIVGLSMRSAEGIRAPGWDGLVDDSSGSPWVPPGPSAWELGAGGDPARKAQDEYAGRTADPLGVDPAITTFVFVTPRRWPRARQWERARRAEGVWRGVRVIDADDLAGWLQSQPATHLWLSEAVGLRPLEVRTLSDWWKHFSRQTDPAVPPELLLAGRRDATVRLRAEATGNAASALYVRGASKEEATAFIAAAFETAPNPPPAALIGLSSQGWERLAVASQPTVLIPYFDDANIATAVAGGHCVIVPLSAGTRPSRQDVIELPALDRVAARDVLVEKAGRSFETADRLAGLARRSLASFLRDPDLAAAPRSRPPWAEGDHARLLGRLVLAGAWSPTEQDQRLVAAIAGRDWDGVENELTAWRISSDPPFIQSGGQWQVASPDGAWGLLQPALQPADVTRFCEKAIEVLAETDPMLELDPDDRLLAGARGVRRAFSSTLREGVAQGLALLGAFSEQFSDGTVGGDYADRAVRQLLARANADSSALLWGSLSPQLPLLAEASPDQFLAAVEVGVAGDAPVLMRMFTDREQHALFGASSPHTGMLWALELLCWAPEHLSRAAGALARLTEVDPGGRLGNRPSGSLRTVFLHWLPRTSAPLVRRLRVLDALRRDHPAPAWELEMAIMPKGHDTSSTTPLPRFRRWATSDERVPVSEWLEAIAETVKRALADAGTDPRRWAEMVGHSGDLPREQRDHLIARLGTLSPDEMDPDARRHLWKTVVDLVEHHRSFPDARWSLDDEPLKRLEAIAESLEPADTVERYARLFDWHPHIPGVDQDDYEGHDRAVSEARADAIARTLDAHGLAGVERLACASTLPEEVGSQTAAVAGEQDLGRILALLGRQDNLGRFAHGWVARMAFDGDADWLQRMASEIGQWPRATQVPFLVGLGAPSARLLRLLASLETSVQDSYWAVIRPFAVDDEVRHAVVAELVAHQRPWAAIDVLSLACQPRNSSNATLPSVEQVVAALDGALAGDITDRARAVSAEYEVGKLLDYLERQGIDQAVLGRLEWSFFRLLEYTRQPRALYAALAREPEFFVDLVCRVFRAKNGSPSAEPDEQTVVVAQNAWSVLNQWRRPPGLDDADHIDPHQLRTWIRRARLLLADRDRADIGDQQIGQVLSGSPAGADEIWPAEEIRELIEDLASKDLESGLSVGIHNARGTTSRGVYDGGAQEWALAEKYRRAADAAIDQWPRTGRLLNELAADYERDARREDAEAQARADEL